MKFAGTIKWQMGLVALGASLLLGSATYAQQDMDPAVFEASATSTGDGFNNMVPVLDNAMATNGQIEYAASVPVAAAAETEAANVGVASLSEAGEWALLAIAALYGTIVLGGILKSASANPLETLHQGFQKVLGLQVRKSIGTA